MWYYLLFVSSQTEVARKAFSNSKSSLFFFQISEEVNVFLGCIIKNLKMREYFYSDIVAFGVVQKSSVESMVFIHRWVSAVTSQIAKIAKLSK